MGKVKFDWGTQGLLLTMAFIRKNKLNWKSIPDMVKKDIITSESEFELEYCLRKARKRVKEMV